MKLRKLLLIALSAIVLLQAVVIPAFAEEAVDVSSVNGCRGADAAVPYLGHNNLIENAQAAFLFEANSDTVMYLMNQDTQLHPAGMVKIMTALVAIENSNMSDVVTVSAAVLETVDKDARTTELVADEILTVEQLLNCVLVQGSNDASAVLAHYVAGSQAAFVDMMNQRAAEIGCSNTVFTNVHGLHDENQLSTARDIAKILDVAIENETFTTLFGRTHYTLEKTNKSEERGLESTNHMMHEGVYEIYYDSRVTGGRTGVNNTGLRCIASTAQQGNMNLICVIMGSESKINDRGIVEQIGGFKETDILLDAGFDGFKTAQVLYEGQSMKQYSVKNGMSDVIVGASTTVNAVVSSDATIDSLTYRYVESSGNLTAPITSGQIIARVEVWDKDVCIAQTDLYAMNDVEEVKQLVIQREEDKGGGWLKIVAIILVVILLLVGVFYILRRVKLRNMEKRRRSERRRHNRRKETDNV